jgi:MFS family permease
VATLAHAPRSALSLGTVGLAVLCVSQFVDVLSVNTAVIALPDIRADLGMSTAAAQWVISAYALLFGGLLLFGGRLADRVGHRGLFVAGMAAFGGASLVCAAAPSGAVLVASRAATGVAAALTVPAALALLVSGTDTGRRRRALGWWTAAGAGGGSPASHSAAWSPTSPAGAGRSSCPRCWPLPACRSRARCERPPPRRRPPARRRRRAGRRRRPRPSAHRPGERG